MKRLWFLSIPALLIGGFFLCKALVPREKVLHVFVEDFVLSSTDPTERGFLDDAFRSLYESRLLPGPIGEPGLSEKYDFNSDRTVLSVTLRPNLHASDGTPLTAKNYLEGIAARLRGYREKGIEIYGFDLAGMDRWRGDSLPEAFEVVNELSFKVHYARKQPRGSGGRGGMIWGFLPANNWHEGHWANPRDYHGAGPWKFASFTDQGFDLVPNLPELYGKMKFDRIEVRRLNEVREKFPTEASVMVLANAISAPIGYNPLVGYPTGQAYAAINCSKAPWSEPKSRAWLSDELKLAIATTRPQALVPPERLFFADIPTNPAPMKAVRPNGEIALKWMADASWQGFSLDVLKQWMSAVDRGGPAQSTLVRAPAVPLKADIEKAQPDLTLVRMLPYAPDETILPLADFCSAQRRFAADSKGEACKALASGHWTAEQVTREIVNERCFLPLGSIPATILGTSDLKKPKMPDGFSFLVGLAGGGKSVP